MTDRFNSAKLFKLNDIKKINQNDYKVRSQLVYYLFYNVIYYKNINNQFYTTCECLDFQSGYRANIHFNKVELIYYCKHILAIWLLTNKKININILNTSCKNGFYKFHNELINNKNALEQKNVIEKRLKDLDIEEIDTKKEFYITFNNYLYLIEFHLNDKDKEFKIKQLTYALNNFYFLYKINNNDTEKEIQYKLKFKEEVNLVEENLNLDLDF